MESAITSLDWLEPIRARLLSVEAEREAVSAEMAAMDGRARRLAEESTHLRALIDLHGETSGSEPVQGQPSSPQPELEGVVQFPVPGLKPSWKDAVRDALEKSGGPVHYRVLYDELRRMGVTFGGQNPSASFLAVLSRETDFSRVGRGMYWLNDRHTPAAAPAIVDPVPPPVRRRRRVAVTKRK